MARTFVAEKICHLKAQKIPKILTLLLSQNLQEEFSGYSQKFWVTETYFLLLYDYYIDL